MDDFHKENNQIAKTLLAFALIRNRVNGLSAEGDQIIPMNPKTFTELATDVYQVAGKKLIINYLQPLKSIKAMAPAEFTQQANDILQLVFQQFEGQMKLWQMAIDGYQTAKRHDFIGECNKLREHFVTVPQTLADTESALHKLFKQNSAYIPITIVGRHEFNPQEAASLIAEYSGQFTAQFDDAELNTKSQSKAHEMKEQSRFRKYFWFDEIYSHSYDQFLVAAQKTFQSKIKKLNTKTEWAEYYAALNDFVDELNKYGIDSFELIYRKE